MGERRWVQFEYIEPVFFVYSYWLFLIFPVMNQYTYYRYSVDVGFPYMNLSMGDEGGCSEEHFGENSTLKELEIEVQTRSANLFTYYMVSCIIPSLVVGPLIGSYSDKKGRKPALIAPLIGSIIESGMILLIMYFDLSLYLIFISGVINGLTGYFTSLWLALMSYLADTVEKAKLSNRMAILDFCLFLAGTIAQLSSGFWIEHLGFKVPMWFLLCSLILALLYTMVFVKETVQPKDNVSFFDPTSYKRLLQIITKPREHGRKNLVVVIVIMGVSVMFSVGMGGVQVLYVLRSPLCWAPSMLGYFLAYRFFTMGVGSVVGIYVLKRCFNEINVARIGFLSQVAALMLLAFSDKTWMVFLVPAVSVFSAIHSPVLSSISSRLVGPEEQGMLFALCGCIAAIGELAGTGLFNSLYPLSLRFGFPGFVFVFAAGATIILLIGTRLFDPRLDVLNLKEQVYSENTAKDELMVKEETKV